MTARVLVFLLLMFSFSQVSLAYSCATKGPEPCSGFKAADVVFVGTVLDIENPPPDDGGLGGPGISRYRFRIDENFAGAQGQEIDVYSGRGGADCSYHFRKGQQYLVFPYRNEDSRLFVGICSPTRAIDGAQAILPQLRAMRDRQRVASVYGVLRSSSQPYASAWDDDLDRILPNTRLELRSEDKTFVAVSDSNGAYAFYGVPEGEYHFTGDLPGHFEFAQEILGGPLPPLKLPAHACFESDLTALPSGRIRGRVLGPNGKPLTFAHVDLFLCAKYKIGSPGWYESQDREKGYFEFQNVSPGDYLLVYNDGGRIDADEPYPRTFYPGVSDLSSAKVIHLDPGQKVDDADINVKGGCATREITVRFVAEADGLPDINYVLGKGSDGQITSEDNISPGVYSISILKSVRYELHGEGYCSATDKKSTTESIQVDGSDESVTNFTLIFPGPGCPSEPSEDSK
jgi:hypothetical protein